MMNQSDADRDYAIMLDAQRNKQNGISIPGGRDIVDIRGFADVDGTRTMRRGIPRDSRRPQGAQHGDAMKRERIAPAVVCAVLWRVGQAKVAGHEVEPWRASIAVLLARVARLRTVRI